MGTRGAYGFRFEGRDYLAYNHFDSYPSGLGVDIARDVQLNFREGEVYAPNVRQLVNMPRDGNNHAEPSGPLSALLASPTTYTHAGNFMADSLFCEWAYVLNLDEGVLEVYRGWQKSKGEGRYVGEEPDKDGYWGVSQIAAIPVGEVTPERVAELGEREEE